MARCGCNKACSCVVQGCANGSATVTGTGSAGDPYIVCSHPAVEGCDDGSTVVTGSGTPDDPFVVCSHTEVEAGDGVIVTGSGTAADPYIVSTDESEDCCPTVQSDPNGSTTVTQDTGPDGQPVYTVVANPAPAGTIEEGCGIDVEINGDVATISLNTPPPPCEQPYDAGGPDGPGMGRWAVHCDPDTGEIFTIGRGVSGSAGNSAGTVAFPAGNAGTEVCGPVNTFTFTNNTCFRLFTPVTVSTPAFVFDGLQDNTRILVGTSFSFEVTGVTAPAVCPPNRPGAFPGGAGPNNGVTEITLDTGERGRGQQAPFAYQSVSLAPGETMVVCARTCARVISGRAVGSVEGNNIRMDQGARY